MKIKNLKVGDKIIIHDKISYSIATPTVATVQRISLKYIEVTFQAIGEVKQCWVCREVGDILYSNEHYGEPVSLLNARTIYLKDLLYKASRCS